MYSYLDIITYKLYRCLDIITYISCLAVYEFIENFHFKIKK